MASRFTGARPTREEDLCAGGKGNFSIYKGEDDEEISCLYLATSGGNLTTRITPRGPTSTMTLRIYSIYQERNKP